MITELHGIQVQHLKNANFKYFGSDNPQQHYLKEIFKNDLTEYYAYPHEIDYTFNSRGLRDEEWPTNLEDVIWAVGDSATLGVGVPYSTTYVNLLKKLTNQHVVNCGKIASCNFSWHLLNAIDIITLYQPKIVIIQWGPFHRIPIPKHDKSNSKTLLGYVEEIENIKKNTTVIHNFIPEFHDAYGFMGKIQNLNICHVITNHIDEARDKIIHYGIKSHEILANDIYHIINNLNEKNLNNG